MEPHLEIGGPREPRDCRSWDPAVLEHLVWMLQKADMAGQPVGAGAQRRIWLPGDFSARSVTSE